MIPGKGYVTLFSPGKMQADFRNLPSVDKLLSDARLKEFEGTYSHNLVLDSARQILDESRLSIAEGSPAPSFDILVELISARVNLSVKPTLLPVINATGVVLHTNLGRAPLSQETIEAMKPVSQAYTNLEFDLSSGKRGSRFVHLESLLCRLTGAEAALVVNNNASAVLLALTALARRKEVITSRGQAVEIGGGFRIPDVMRQSGAKLVEVGTTNCTYQSDYEQAITPRTAALLRVHSSNFKVVGFTQMVTLEEMVRLGAQHGLPVLDDLGSGCFLDTARFGLSPEPMVQDSINTGAGLALFSGDKLLGGPQAGIIVGKKYLIDKLKRHPLARAVRIDKIRLAGLTATLLHYLKEEAEQKIPIWQMISTPLEEIEKRAHRWAQSLTGIATVINGESVVGGGSLPGSTLPTWLVAIESRGQIRLPELAGRLREHQPPVIGRIEEDSLLLDPRTVLPGEDDILLQAFDTALKSMNIA